MRHKFICITLLTMFVLLFSPVSTFALTSNEFVQNNINILAKTNNNDIDLGQYNQPQTCDGNDSILGNVNDENSVAWLLQQIFNYIKVIGPLLVVVLSSIDFAKVIVKSDDEAMAKAQKKLGMRLILAAALFFIPTIVAALLDVFGFTSSATCGIQ